MTTTQTLLPIDSLTREELLLLADKLDSALYRLGTTEDWGTFLLVTEVDSYVRHEIQLRYH